MTASAALDDRHLLPPSLENKPASDFSAGGLWREELRTLEKELRFEFGMLKTEVSSPVESDESEEDEFFARLTQPLSLSDSRNVSPVDFHIQKSPEGLKVSGGSPQSTLGGIGSWSGRSSNESNHNSPPATPFEPYDDTTLGLIYAAAGQVARLERNVEDPLQASINGQWRAFAKPNPHQDPNAGFYSVLEMKRKYMAAARQASEAVLFCEHHLQNMKRSETFRNSGYGASSEVLTQSARPHCQRGRAVVKPNFQALPLQRKESAGTGVFIPRRYDSNSSVPPRKRAVAPCALVPAKVVLALNTSIETMSASSRPIPSSASLSQQSYDALMAKRRALLDQQQRSMARRTEDISPTTPELEACLPQEWSY